MIYSLILENDKNLSHEKSICSFISKNLPKSSPKSFLIVENLNYLANWFLSNMEQEQKYINLHKRSQKKKEKS